MILKTHHLPMRSQGGLGGPQKPHTERGKARASAGDAARRSLACHDNTQTYKPNSNLAVTCFQSWCCCVCAAAAACALLLLAWASLLWVCTHTDIHCTLPVP